MHYQTKISNKIPCIFLSIVKDIILIMFVFAFPSCDNELVNPENKPDNKDTSVVVVKPQPIIKLFDIDAFPEILIEITTDEWNKFLTYYDRNQQNEEYVMCSFTIVDNSTIIKQDSCGLRLKGNTSRRRPEGKKGEIHNSTNPDWHHASFSIKFNKYIKSQEIAAIDRINLKWFKDDAMYLREVYCYDLFERFGVWTAPKSSYARLKLKIKEDKNTVYYGVYQLLEVVNDDYLKSRKKLFADDNGFLWKANWGADFVSPNTSAMDIENITLDKTYTPVYDLKTNTQSLVLARQILVDFIENLNSKSGNDFKAWISTVTDVPLFLKTYAVSVLCGMWDDYWVNKNNFYFYFNSQGKFFFIPYDYDNTLGTSSIMNDSGRQNLLNWGNNSHPLVKKIIDIPEYRSLYISYIRELCNPANDLFHATKSGIRITNWHNMISNYISNDTGEDMIIEDKPASWGNCGFYRLLGNSNNYFVIRAENIP
jgi:spore coat protein CotH